MSLNVTSNIGVIGYSTSNETVDGFVTVAYNSNYFAYSTDGITWTESTISDTSRYWQSVCYGNGKFVAVASSTNIFAYSTDGITWTEGMISDAARSWESICYGNGKFVAVGGSDYFVYSTDGMNWTEGTISGTDIWWYSVCYGNDKFVAVGFDNYFAYSTDGITWTEGTISSSSRCWKSVCYGNDKFVTITKDYHYFAYSTDGITWTEESISNTSRSWWSVCYGNDKFVTVAYNSNIFAYSMDGITWTETSNGLTNRSWTFVCYGNGKYIAIANNSNYFAYSTDGINWTKGTISDTSRNWYSVCYGTLNKSIGIPEKAFNLSQPENASTTEFSDKVILDSIVHHDSPMYLLINQKATNNNFYIHSPNLGDLELPGSDRKIYPVDSNMNRNCIGGKLHPLGNGYVAYSVYSNNMSDTTPTSKQSDTDTGSLELITGVIKANPYLGYYKAVNGINFYGIENDVDEFLVPYRDLDGKFVAISGGSDNSKYFAYSTDGINWTEGTISDTSRTWTSVCYGNGKFVAITWNSNYFAYSTDGITWTEGTISDTSRNWHSVCYGNGKFVAVADSTNIFAYSTDGMNWTEGTISSTSRDWYSVCYGNGKFITIDRRYKSNIFAYSMDGINWTETMISETSINKSWRVICYGNDKFVAIGQQGYFAYSTDGITWTEGTIGSTKRNWQSVCYGNGKFVTVATDIRTIKGTYFAYSYDGITWIEDVINNINSDINYWMSVCYGNGKFVIVGYNFDSNWNLISDNNFAYSTDGIHWTESINNPYIRWYSVCYASISNIEFSNNHTGISSDVTDINGVSTMTTYTEQYSEDIYYIHYAWVDRASSSLVRYNILTRKIDTSGDKPVISNLTSYTTTFSIGTIAHPSFHKDKNGIHCAFYHGSTAYTKYYKLTRSGTDDSTWSWGTDSNTYITNENVSLMTNYISDNIQSPMAQSARRMYMVNNDGNLVEFKKTQTF